ncbi:hypothetical protein GCM10023144_02650 [Pigmentiphaga soli]|uniref:LysR substrate-binding domain-containing protein n=1 Tax=Pigmentiphaga soli TaxID=1007095 RepID=A0ABP8GDZ4_9BURK
MRTEPFIRYDPSAGVWRLAERYLQAQGIRPHQRLEVDNLATIAALVDQGLGIALVPDWSCLWPHGMSIATIALPGAVPVRRIGVIWRERGPHAALARVFFQEVRTVLASLDGDGEALPGTLA